MEESRLSATVTLEVPFHDVDAMEVVWHGHYYKYFEIARTALARRLDYDQEAMSASGYVWPVIECTCRFARPLKYGMKFTVTATLIEWEHRMKILYVIHERDGGRRMARGHSVQVAVERETGTMCFASPRALVERVERWT